MGAKKPVMDKIEQRRLRRYDNVRRMENGSLPKASQNWEIAGRNTRGQPLTTWDHKLGYGENCTNR